MPARRLLMKKIREVLRLDHELGLSHRGDSPGLRRWRGHGLAVSAEHGSTRAGLPLPAELDDAALAALLFLRAAPVHDRVRATLKAPAPPAAAGRCATVSKL